LSVHIPVEKLYFKQKEMIQKCHAAGKPVIIVSQVLESMVQGVVPTTSEINDIAGLVRVIFLLLNYRFLMELMS
jgi:Pyruvate kinase